MKLHSSKHKINPKYMLNTKTDKYITNNHATKCRIKNKCIKI